MTAIEIIMKEVEKGENLSLINRVKRTGQLTEEKAQKLMRQFGLEEPSEDMKKVLRYKGLERRIDTLKRMRAEIGEANRHDLAELATYEMGDKERYDEEIAELEAEKKALYDNADRILKQWMKPY